MTSPRWRQLCPKEPHHPHVHHDHVHGLDCGHEPVKHGDHIDYLVDGQVRGAAFRGRRGVSPSPCRLVGPQLHSTHGGHCDFHGFLNTFHNSAGIESAADFLQFFCKASELPPPPLPP